MHVPVWLDFQFILIVAAIAMVSAIMILFIAGWREILRQEKREDEIEAIKRARIFRR